MVLDFVIQNGLVIDPARNICEVQNLGVLGNRMVAITKDLPDALHRIDASGCLVVPGLIDFHSHIFQSGGITPVRPDLELASGVTSVVDAGTSGCANFDAFYRTDIVNSHVRIKSYLNVCSTGIADEFMPENLEPEFFNQKAIVRVFEKYPSKLLGLKVRMAKDLVKSIAPLEKTLEIARDLGQVSVCVHPTNPPESVSSADILDLLNAGDVFCHVYHGRGSTILDCNGRVRSEVYAAKERGVIFDVANGKGNFCHAVANAAIKQGLWPDIISTDLGVDKLYLSLYARSLPYVMSKLYSMGMELNAVIRAVTQTPAKLMGMAGQIGTLAPGAYADIAVFKLIDRPVRYLDFFNEEYIGHKLFVPQLTMSDGEVVYAQADFNI